jgi:hypothetical protein
VNFLDIAALHYGFALLQGLGGIRAIQVRAGGKGRGAGPRLGAAAAPSRPRPALPLSDHTIPDQTMPCHTIPYHTIPYHTMPYHAMPYHAIPYHAIPCHTMPYPVVRPSPPIAPPPPPVPRRGAARVDPRRADHAAAQQRAAAGRAVRQAPPARRRQGPGRHLQLRAAQAPRLRCAPGTGLAVDAGPSQLARKGFKSARGNKQKPKP